ncbi:hemolysin-III related [Musa troglodytarum]|uniref:Hemolysin-III related n=1 Tax=Musa troglodytarum TaxID=320322 RepID=A0A9E7GB98_9LILI|nr:hemolysin-III related [Musa troglodytarum]
MSLHIKLRSNTDEILNILLWLSESTISNLPRIGLSTPIAVPRWSTYTPCQTVARRRNADRGLSGREAGEGAAVVEKGEVLAGGVPFPAGYLKDNEDILSYYRSVWPLRQILLGVFTIHNETINVWTHLIGFFLFLALTIYTAMKISKVVDLQSLQHLPEVLKKADLQRIQSELMACLPSLPHLSDLQRLKDVLKTSLASMDVLPSSLWHGQSHFSHSADWKAPTRPNMFFDGCISLGPDAAQTQRFLSPVGGTTHDRVTLLSLFSSSPS